MSESDDWTRHAAAQAMLDAFASVGASRFDVTWTDLAGVEQGFRRNVMTAYLARMMPAELDAAAGTRHLPRHTAARVAGQRHLDRRHLPSPDDAVRE